MKAAESDSDVKFVPRQEVHGGWLASFQKKQEMKKQAEKSPVKDMHKSPVKDMHKSPIKEGSRSISKDLLKAPEKDISPSPIKELSKSPVRVEAEAPKISDHKSPQKSSYYDFLSRKYQKSEENQVIPEQEAPKEVEILGEKRPIIEKEDSSSLQKERENLFASKPQEPSETIVIEDQPMEDVEQKEEFEGKKSVNQKETILQQEKSSEKPKFYFKEDSEKKEEEAPKSSFQAFLQGRKEAVEETKEKKVDSDSEDQHKSKLNS